MFETFSGISLKLDEKIRVKAKPSKQALLISWLVIPVYFFVVYGLPLIGPLCSVIFMSSIRKKAVTEGLSLLSYAWEHSIGGLAGILKFIIIFPTVLLGIIWFLFCLVLTYRHFQYAIAITEKRLIGKSGGREVSVPLKKIKNVYLEQSLWGKLLKYGTIVVNTTNGNFEFKNISAPEKIKSLLMEHASSYCG